MVERITAFNSEFLGNSRSVDIYLPPGYAPGWPGYPVLYANDGQEMAQWRLQETLAELCGAGAIRPPIVVAAHATAMRLHEYGVAGHPNAQGLGERAGAYGRFVTEELMPYVEARFPVLRGPAHTVAMGASLGGLAAFDLAWRHPGRFGAVGVFSGSFWWRTDDSSVAARQSSRIMHRVVRATPGRPALRMWFEVGRYDETSDRDGNGVIDAIQDTTELMDELAARGYAHGPDMRYVEVDGGHSPHTWGQVLPEFLRWAFPPR